MLLPITLIRHGKTAGNLTGCYIGTTDERLCEEGIQQLKAGLVENRYSPVSRVYASGLMRCLQTAALLYPDIAAIPAEGLRECGFGDFEGKNYEQLKNNPDYQRWLDSGGTIPFPNGEDSLAFRERCQKAFFEICCQQQEPEPLAIICHGGSIMAILERVGRQEFYHWQVKNGGGYSFLFDTDTKTALNIKKLEELE